ncbi:stage III sporulation protein AG [Lachnospiraceae bacterium ZAX-1]
MKPKTPFDFTILKKINKSHLFIAFLAGILLLVVAIPVNDQRGTKEEPSKTAETGIDTSAYYQTKREDYQSDLEEKLKEALSSMEGVGRAEVMITLKDTGESIVEKDMEKSENNTAEEDGGGAKRNLHEMGSKEDTVYIQENTSGSTPFVAKELNPVVEGVFVVAEGGGDAIVIKNISDAILALFPIEAHKIKVVKMKMN